ncbi:MAG: hypothetical protein ACRDV4_00760, partial [Acidimicrobiales bacterium]
MVADRTSGYSHRRGEVEVGVAEMIVRSGRRRLVRARRGAVESVCAAFDWEAVLCAVEFRTPRERVPGPGAARAATCSPAEHPETPSACSGSFRTRPGRRDERQAIRRVQA